MTATKEAPAWAKGIPIERLKEIAGLFREHDKGLIRGAFTAYKENSVAEAIDAGRLLQADDCYLDIEEVERRRTVKDFTGEARAIIPPGDVLVRRFAYADPRKAASIINGLIQDYPRVWVMAWIEHRGDQAIMQTLGFSLAAVKIAASSELRGLYHCDGRGESQGMLDVGASGPEIEPLPAADAPALALLDDSLRLEADALAKRLDRRGLEYAGHYSAYGKGDTWSALALRGYSDDPSFIIKPAEMSKKWKRENPEALDWELRDTPLREKLPEAEPLISALPGEPHRIRLMRLAPGGGELERHADITDPDAGTADGKTLRLHFPIQTNPEVRFNAWGLDGSSSEARMAEGECWYLDTRKPHTAINGGDSERIHLVIDMESCAELRGLVERAQR